MPSSNALRHAVLTREQAGHYVHFIRMGGGNEQLRLIDPGPL
jgi:hypothetical protein